MNFEIPKSKVYVLTDDRGCILRCEGGYTISNCQVIVDTGEVDKYGRPITTAQIADGWTFIDEGTGDRYNLCQNHYFPGGLYTADGIPRYKLVDGAPQLRADGEIAIDRAANLPPEPEPTAEELMDILLGVSE